MALINARVTAADNCNQAAMSVTLSERRDLWVQAAALDMFQGPSALETN